MSEVRPGDPLVSIIVPVLDEQECILELARRVRAAMTAEGVRYELLFVDDGSRDATPVVIAQLQREDPTVRVIRFTRRFGHQAALSAGLEFRRPCPRSQERGPPAPEGNPHRPLAAR